VKCARHVCRALAIQPESADAPDVQPDEETTPFWSTKHLQNAVSAAVFSAKSALLGAEWLPSDVQTTATERLENVRDDVNQGLEDIEANLADQVGEIQQSVADIEANSFDTLSDARAAVESTVAAISGEEATEADFALPVVPAIQDTNCQLKLQVTPQRARASQEQAVEQFMTKPMQEIAPALLSEYYAKIFKADLKVREVDAGAGQYELTIPAVTLSLPLATIASRAVDVQLHCSNAPKKDGEYMERGHFDVILQDGKDICEVKLGFPFFTNYPISAAGWGRTSLGWEHEEVLTQLEGDCGIQLMQVPGLRSVMEYFARNTLREAMADNAAILAKSVDAV